jgi:hypothetical protein
MNKTLEIKTLKMTGSKGFSLLAGVNRPIIPQHVTKLATSLDAIGIIRPVVVAKFASSPRAAASSSRVSRRPGAPATRLLICVPT